MDSQHINALTKQWVCRLVMDIAGEYLNKHTGSVASTGPSGTETH